MSAFENPFARVDKRNLAQFLEMTGFSVAQANWLSNVLPLASDKESLALSLVVAERFGPRMTPFEATDEELMFDAEKLIQHGFLVAWNLEGATTQ